MRDVTLRRPWIWALALTGLLASSGAWAQSPSEPEPAAEAKTDPETPAKKHEAPPGFEPVSGKERAAESVSAPLMVVLAYAAFFVLMFGYVAYVVKGQTALSKELKDLDAKIKKAGGS